MKHKTIIAISLVLITMLSTSCGPSPEEKAATSAAMTAAAATDTPVPTATSTPTPTPTPIPYDLTLTVMDEDNNPLAGADVLLSESGDEQPAAVDNAGQVSWTNLPGNTVSLIVNAQGYTSVEKTETIQRGANEISIVLERDPYQILPSEACLAGLEPLYIEDFEDGEAQGWSDIVRPKWAFEKFEDRGTTLALVAENEGGWSAYMEEFGNAIWLFDMNTTGTVYGLDINFHVKETPNGIAHYKINYHSYESIALHVSAPDQELELGGAFPPPLVDGNWHQVAFVYFDGSLDVWIDGKLWLGADHKDNPIETGGLAFGFPILENPIYLDNMVVCGLSEPYQPAAEE